MIRIPQVFCRALFLPPRQFLDIMSVSNWVSMYYPLKSLFPSSEPSAFREGCYDMTFKLGKLFDKDYLTQTIDFYDQNPII